MGDGFSVLILTYDEEQSLPGCLESVRECDDIVVLDSFSHDQTKHIAEQFGARFFQREFDNYAAQRNYGLNNIEFRHSWVLFLDADERVSTELISEIRMSLNGVTEDFGLFRMRRKDFLFGKWLKHSSGYPTWFGRLVKIGAVRIEREINEEYITEKQIGLLNNHLYHYPFIKGMRHWLDKHNRYSTMEAEILYKNKLGKMKFQDLFSADPANRRNFLKNAVYRMPCRPILIFMALYIFRFGFLDGLAGLLFCRLRYCYELLIDCKVREMRFKTGSAAKQLEQ